MSRAGGAELALAPGMQVLCWLATVLSHLGRIAVRMPQFSYCESVLCSNQHVGAGNLVVSLRVCIVSGGSIVKWYRIMLHLRGKEF